MAKDEEAGGAKPPLGLSPSKPKPGSRPGSLGSSLSTIKAPPLSARTSLKTKCSGVPGIDRDALRAGLAKHVLETAEGRVNDSAAADGAHHGSERQALEGTGQRLSLKASSVETVQRYLTLELASSYPAATTPDLTQKSTQ